MVFLIHAGVESSFVTLSIILSLVTETAIGVRRYPVGLEWLGRTSSSSSSQQHESDLKILFNASVLLLLFDIPFISGRRYFGHHLSSAHSLL